MADVREPNQIRCECKVKQSKYHKLAIPYSEIEQVIISLLSTIEISDDDYEEYRKFVCNELEKIRKKNVEENASIQRDINRVKSEKKKYIERNM
jgi:acetone carboxylase gamma subunit